MTSPEIIAMGIKVRYAKFMTLLSTPAGTVDINSNVSLTFEFLT